MIDNSISIQLFIHQHYTKIFVKKIFLFCFEKWFKLIYGRNFRHTNNRQNMSSYINYLPPALYHLKFKYNTINTTE